MRLLGVNTKLGPLLVVDHCLVLAEEAAPDCLPEDVVELLGRLNREKPVWVELGLQTIWPETAEYIRRELEPDSV